MMQVFDAPDALGSLGERPTTTIAPQALLLMNNPNVRGYARSFARRIAGIPLEDAVKAGYEIALGRPPETAELVEALAFVQAQTQSYTESSKQQALTDLCQVLMCLNEFVYVD
jgi:hypothetical protein